MTINTHLWLERKHSEYLQFASSAERSPHCAVTCTLNTERFGGTGCVRRSDYVLGRSSRRTAVPCCCLSWGCAAEVCANDSRCLAERFPF